MKWSPQQDRARGIVSRWMRDPSAPQVLYLAGVAGTGKSTLAEDLVSDSSRQWLFGAYTGKAAYVLQQKGCAGAKTLHSLIYRPAGDENAEQIERLEEEIGRSETTPSRRIVWLHYFDGRREEIENAGHKRRRHSEFDWGYALTVHKAQGSQYDKVLIVDESRKLGGTEPRRWMYTAITRSKEHVTILT